jgi:hypothetical protein
MSGSSSGTFNPGSFRMGEERSMQEYNITVNGSLVHQDSLISTIIDGINTTQARNSGIPAYRDR